MNFTEIFNKLIFNRKALPFIVCMFALGIFMVMFSNGNHNNLKTKQDLTPFGKDYENEMESDAITEDSIDSKSLEHILSKIKGVGDVCIEVVYGSSAEKVAMKLKDENGNETTVFENIDSNSKPFITKEKSPEIIGVIIVAEGGGDIKIKSDIIESVSDVFDIPMHKVKVFEMK